MNLLICWWKKLIVMEMQDSYQNKVMKIWIYADTEKNGSTQPEKSFLPSWDL